MNLFLRFQICQFAQQLQQKTEGGIVAYKKKLRFHTSWYPFCKRTVVINTDVTANFYCKLWDRVGLIYTVGCQLGTGLEREIVGLAGEVYPVKTFDRYSKNLKLSRINDIMTVYIYDVRDRTLDDS